MNKFEQRSRDTYNQAAADYDDSAEGHFTYQYNRRLADAIEIPAGGRVLDIACGSGRLLHMLSEWQSFEGFGVDISENMVETARLANPGMGFHRATCDDLPFDDAFFDVITVCTAFHHFPNAKAFAREVSRVLAPGGSLYIADVYYPALLRVLFNPLVKLSPAGDVRFYSPQEITRLLSSVGLTCNLVIVEKTLQLIVAQKPESL